MAKSILRTMLNVFRETARSLLCVALSMLLTVVVLAGAAWAQTVEAAGQTIDLWPVIEPLIGLAVAALAALGGWAIRWFVRKLKLDVDDKVRAYMENGFMTALNYGQAVLSDRARGLSAVEIKNQTLLNATAYFVRAFPDGMKHFGLTEAGVKERLTAWLDLTSRPPAAVVPPTTEKETEA